MRRERLTNDHAANPLDPPLVSSPGDCRFRRRCELGADAPGRHPHHESRACARVRRLAHPGRPQISSSVSQLLYNRRMQATRHEEVLCTYLGRGGVLGGGSRSCTMTFFLPEGKLVVGRSPQPRALHAARRGRHRHLRQRRRNAHGDVPRLEAHPSAPALSANCLVSPYGGPERHRGRRQEDRPRDRPRGRGRQRPAPVLCTALADEFECHGRRERRGGRGAGAEVAAGRRRST